MKSTRRLIVGLALAGIACLALDAAFPLPEAARARAQGVDAPRQASREDGSGAKGPAPVTIAKAAASARLAAAREQGLVVVAENGLPLRTWPSADGALRHPVEVEAVSPLYVQALLTYEDRWFDWHPGINPVAMVRAGYQWLRHGRVVSGGSTLTMQVARIIDESMHGAARRGVGTKLRQMARALQLEWHLSKRDILTLYLNHAPMGGQVEGVEMASRAYLGKPAKDLSHAEAAMLVALPQRPSLWRPDRAPGLAQGARDKVLTRMAALGVWPDATVQDARLERVFAAPLRARWLAPLAAERLRREHAAAPAAQQEAQSHPRQQGRQPGQPVQQAVIRSTLDTGIQMRLERVLLDRLGALPDKVSIAALVVDNTTMAIRGYAGSADFTDNARAAHVDMVRGVRSPGSTLKPFLYALALDEGLVHSESLLVDAPQNFGGYAPGNFQAAFSGAVSLSDALQRSLNVPAVDLLDRLGPERFTARLRDAGLRLRLPAGARPNLSIILGGAGTTLEELVGAYSALARGGMAGRPRLRPDEPLVETRLMSRGAAFIVREILENGGRPDAPFRESKERIAWKTGTSFGFRDAWAIGVTDRYTVGVWVGRPDGTPNPGHFGANTAAPLVKDLLMALGPTLTQPRAVPAEVRAVDICWPLGLAADATPSADCRVRRAAWTLDGTTPPTLPDRIDGTGLRAVAWVNAAGTRRVDPHCPSAQTRAMRAIDHARWPTLLGPWIDRGMRSPVENLPWADGCHGDAPRSSLHLTGIEPGSILQKAPGAPDISVRVQVIGTRDKVTWLLDGVAVGTAPDAPHTVTLNFREAGAHALTALDAQGRFQRVSFSVR